MGRICLGVVYLAFVAFCDSVSAGLIWFDEGDYLFSFASSVQSLKRSVITFFRGTGLRWLVMGALNLLAWLVLGLARLVGWLYAKAYPVLGLSYYDQRFDWMLGPQSWRWAERGIVSYQAGIPGGRMLDLACGEGLYPGEFLSKLGGEVDAVDMDAGVIARARRRYGSASVRFHIADVLRDPFPGDEYDLIACMATFQYFPPEQAHVLLARIAGALTKRAGRFVGSVPVVKQGERGAANNFLSVEQVRQMMARHFERVDLWCSTWEGGRMLCYWRCERPVAQASRRRSA